MGLIESLCVAKQGTNTLVGLPLAVPVVLFMTPAGTMGGSIASTSALTLGAALGRYGLVIAVALAGGA